MLMAAVLTVAVAGVAAEPATPATPVHTVARRALLPGVAYERLAGRPSVPLAVHVAEVAPEAPVELRVVLSNDRVLENDAKKRTELTTSMCRRAGGIVCVNGDFASCRTCGDPFGGVAIDGAPVRSHRPGHEQLSLLTTGLTTTPVPWTATITATYEVVVPGEPDDDGGLLVDGAEPEPRTQIENRSLSLDGVNIPRGNDQLVVYTPWYATRTQTRSGAEAIFRTSRRLQLGRASRLDPVRVQGSNSVIPGDGLVVSGHGSGATRLRDFWDEYRTKDARSKQLTIEISASQPVLESMGGHPVVLRDGRAPEHDPRDTMVYERHPRTLIGWNDAGRVWLVTIDGRQPGHSVGATIAEATDVLRSLGATEGINLDGGGSTTFASPVGCSTRGTCVTNRPSDGRERKVTVALALVPTRRLQARAVAAPAAAAPAPKVERRATAAPAPRPAPKPVAKRAPVVAQRTVRQPWFPEPQPVVVPRPRVRVARSVPLAPQPVEGRAGLPLVVLASALVVGSGVASARTARGLRVPRVPRVPIS